MTDELRRTWGINVKALRQSRGLTQEQLAHLVGVKKPTVSRWEAGLAAPRDSHKVSVATVFNVDVRTLFPLIRMAS